MPRPTFGKAPGDGRDRPTERTETTQSFERQRKPPATPPTTTPQTQPANPQRPPSSGGGSGIITVPSGILKGQSGKLFTAIAGTDYEAALGNPAVDGYVLSSTAAGQRSWVPLSGTGGDYGGTVTSVGLSVPSEFSVTGSPVTSAGVITVGKATQEARKFFAGPVSGANAVPIFRYIEYTDLPNSGVVAGTYSHATVTVDTKGRVTYAASGSGGGGRTSTTVSQYVHAGASVNVSAPLGMMAEVFRVVSSHPVWLRCYGRADARAADAARSILIDPEPATGCLLEINFAPTVLDLDLAPGVEVRDREDTPTGNIACRMTNNTGNGETVGITFHYVPLES